MNWIWLPLSALIVVLFLPRIGLIALARSWHSLRKRVLVEDALKHLLDREHRGFFATPTSLAGALGLDQKRTVALVLRMETAGLLTSSGRGLRLTTEGERWGIHVVRAHRLWERYLSDEAGVPLTKLHRSAERIEHHLSAEDLDALDAHLGHPRSDPHGAPIPAADGRVTSFVAVPLTDWPAGEPGRIVHVEDEPEPVLEQIIAADLKPGKIVRVLENAPERIVISDGENEIRLANVVASNIQVTSAPDEASRINDAVPLAELDDGRNAEIIALDSGCRGFSRRRLLDLGLTPGTRVKPLLTNFAGDPRAYRVRSTTIGLRRSQAERIWVRPDDTSTEEA